MTHYAGMNLPDPQPEEVALGAVVLMKIMKADGSVTYREVADMEGALHPVEMLGMVETFSDSLRQLIMGRYQAPRPPQ